jgi:hypothetical protein
MAKEGAAKEILIVFLEREVANYLWQQGKKIEDLTEGEVRALLELVWEQKFLKAHDKLWFDIRSLTSMIKDRLKEDMYIPYK